MLSVPQVFGKDNVLTLGGETAESRQQWAEDMDVDVSLCQANPHNTIHACFRPQAIDCPILSVISHSANAAAAAAGSYC